MVFNPEHDAAIVDWLTRPTDFPLDAVNFALQKLYEQNLLPFIYEAYNGDDEADGLLIAESMELEDEEIYALFNQIREANQAASQTGEWRPQEFVV